MSAARRRLLEEADAALAKLDGAALHMPEIGLFLYAYVRKEAVLSSQIEGTQSSLSDLMLFELEEAPGVPFDDVVEVSNYVAALEHGLDRLRKGFPLSGRLIRDVHAVLLSRGRGNNKAPGEYRRSQNWIGASRPEVAEFIPPPPNEVEAAMADLERFLNDEPVRTSTLLKAALAQVQFETIHPFLDGNGRVGRLLIPMLLCVDGVLREPLLYLSLYFKQNRARYYELLNRVRAHGEWEEWVEFFARGVEETANGAVMTALRMNAMAQADRAAIQTAGRVVGSALQIHHALLARPLNTIARLSRDTRLSVPAVTSALKALMDLGLVTETTGRKRGRIFAYGPYLELLQSGTEPL
jgi:Fic family protein